MSTFSRTPGTALTVALPEPNLATIPEQLSHQGMSVEELARGSAEPRLTDECRHGLTAFFDKKPAPWVPE